MKGAPFAVTTLACAIVAGTIAHVVGRRSTEPPALQQEPTEAPHRRPAPGQRAAKRPQRTDYQTALAGLAAGHGTPKNLLAVPKLSELELLSYKDWNAFTLLRSAKDTVGRRLVAARRGCGFRSDDPASDVKAVFHISASARSYTVTDVRLQVRRGAPVPDEKVQCVLSFVKAPFSIDAANGDSFTDYEGEFGVDISTGCTECAGPSGQ